MTPRVTGTGMPGGIPLLGGFGPTQVNTIKYSGTSLANTWITLVTGSTTDPTLPDGVYIM